ncbi:unnamed protein product [Ceutorhynchus assimilis]|uniref:Trehalase n=1 Tax=Ceutorhynchus assimilis TaxID=467358 RepID=A0A9N9MP77_9CUCU|nr:unnamed protein product [Ceutorhynchus assimilis]
MKLIHFCYIFIQLAFAKPNHKILSIQKESCDSLVYCQGTLLDTVQRARIFSDSKTFVDLSQTNAPEITLQNFQELMTSTNNNPTKEQIIKFVNANFVESTELEEWTPEDFNANPDFLNKIKDKQIKQFAGDLVKIWPSLGRKIGQTVFDNPEKHSLIGVPNGIIIPGGRFKEFYYWDSYWIIEGLILSEMVDTARGMIENLLFMVELYGFVPNGGRVYYLNRSQPPLLTLMAGLYFDHTNDIAWLQKNLPLLDNELTYWLDQKTVDVVKNCQTYRMAHYLSQSDTPRPESYYEDITTCKFFINDEGRKHCYQGLKSGAESGWDFSSRWFFDQEGGIKTNLTHIDAQRVIPVDLNAILCAAFKRISSFYELTGDLQNAAKWALVSKQWLQAIEEVLYDDTDGIWYDYDPVLSKSRKMFYPSNFAPLWTETYNFALKNEYGRRAAEYYTDLNIGEFKGGIPTSLDGNNEQWDLPNAWPPLQEFVILGLWNTGNRRAKSIARQSAERWIQANLIGYREETAMFEKYDATKVGQYGGGGEYQVQKGFGWSNGVALNLIDKFFTSRRPRISNSIVKLLDEVEE